ncbi:phosphoribosylaminoimidazole chloroplastic [Micractinium conductrix]|uniref:phosphoribosylaminoimidazole carboxylase n=1 Tax=Micractinium conductrix TaxID=554055 RepID=A0A2P6V6H4_9CHLO|nr:phosphoribosylaminoimidazole chloroplastic [Micractinium conductrix]|eukprot:PSC69680.1 phosphoribosylaminoimidazole chloroplastic [Micractinium conductrix]
MRQGVTCSAAPAAGEAASTKVVESGLPRTAVVGVLGGGQLGKMMGQEAAKMGVTLRVLDPTPDCPASVVAQQTEGSFRDAAAVQAFAQGCDVLTVEIEHIDADAMQTVADGSGVEVQPTPQTLRIIQDKFVQKQHFQAAGVPLPEYREIKCGKCAEGAGHAFGYPYMLKSKKLAYDGRGNAVVRSEADIAAAVASLGGYEKGLYAEKWVPFVCELAVMVVRSRDGALSSFPVVQTIHKDNICWTTEAPPRVPLASQAASQAVAEQAVRHLEGAGVFGVETFLLPDGSVLLNEVAPRPHNSGHYTIEACSSSQFEAHLRAVLGWPLGDTRLRVGASIMLNILGEAEGEEGERAAHELMGRAYATPGASVHWYGKAGVAAQRKIGHITIVGKDNAEARARLRAIDPAAADAIESSTARVASELQLGGAAGDPSAPKVGIIMGSDSDLATMKAAAEIMEEFGVACEVTVVSAHRTPERMFEYARSAHQRGIRAIIAGAGGAAHLPGMVAAMTPLPVIGVPVKPAGAHLDGIDALLSIVQMPRGVPVATVAIGNAANAGLLAVRILATADPALQSRMLAYQEGMTQTVLGKAERLETKGWRDY